MPYGGVVELRRRLENLVDVTEDGLQVFMHAFVIDGLLIAIQDRVPNCVAVKATYILHLLILLSLIQASLANSGFVVPGPVPSHQSRLAYC